MYLFVNVGVCRKICLLSLMVLLKLLVGIVDLGGGVNGFVVGVVVVGVGGGVEVVVGVFCGVVLNVSVGSYVVLSSVVWVWWISVV